MAENNKKLFTESFEKVVNTFYDTVEAASPITKSTIHTDEIGTVARAIVKKFNGSEPLNEFNEAEDTGILIDDKPVTVSVDQTGKHQHQVPEQVSLGVTVAIVESPEPSPESPAPEQYQQVLGIQRMRHPEIYAKAVRSTNHQDTFNEVYLRTSNPSHIIAFEWTLENFSRYVDEVHSSVFSAQNCEKTWQASIVISRNQEENAEYLELYMNALSVFKETVHAHYSLGVYNKLGECFQERMTIAKFTKDRHVHQCLITKGPYVKNSSNNVRIYDDEIILKGSIQLTGCCVVTRRSGEPKLKPI